MSKKVALSFLIVILLPILVFFSFRCFSYVSCGFHSEKTNVSYESIALFSLKTSGGLGGGSVVISLDEKGGLILKENIRGEKGEVRVAVPSDVVKDVRQAFVQDNFLKLPEEEGKGLPVPDAVTTKIQVENSQGQIIHRVTRTMSHKDISQIERVMYDLQARKTDTVK